jgi:hypothetical protein
MEAVIEDYEEYEHRGEEYEIPGQLPGENAGDKR